MSVIAERIAAPPRPLRWRFSLRLLLGSITVVALGLMYPASYMRETLNEAPTVKVTYSLTSMGCPVGPMIEQQITETVAEMPGVEGVESELTWDPPWTPERMSDDAKFILGFG